jgi:MFS family permease
MESLGLGWRGLYGVAIVPLFLIARWRRTLPETERFELHRRTRGRDQRSEWALAPMVHLVRAYPGRFAMLSSVILVGSVCGAAADFLGPKYLQDAHGWEPSGVALLFVFGGVFGIFGATFAGRSSDRFGRRPVAIAIGAALTCLSITFYNAPDWLLAPTWVAMVFALMGNDAVFAAFAGELFPTSHRSTASGARAIVATLGASFGLVLESVLYGVFGSHWTAVSVLLAGTALIPLIVWLTFPETAGKSLEEIAPERD